jgi:dienelactone hydrolase
MDLYPYQDLPEILGFNDAKKSAPLKQNLIESFGRLPNIPQSLDILRENSYIYEGVEITPISWWCGYGPRTQGYLVRAENVKDPLPGILYLHSHDDVKQFGVQKVLDGAGELPPELAWVKEIHYGGQAPVNELAKQGFAVLVFDCFLWGSRRFVEESMPSRLSDILNDNNFEDLAVMHESMVLSKYLSLFGTTLAGLLNFDDRVALEVMKSLEETTEQIGVVGLSGGGCRAVYLHATSPEITATVVVGAMATYASMIDQHVAPHSWMYFPNDLASKMDWPQVAMLGSEGSLYVQFCANDQLFTLAGMQDADKSLGKHYEPLDAEYKSDFYPVKHSFTTQMQKDAFEWLKKILLRD